MLSILIPIYQYDVSALVQDLRAQALQLSVPWEIYLLDDASGEVWDQCHRLLGDLSGIRYEALPHNIGRAAIRNRLAEQARYDFLLFLDGDSGIVRDDFLRVYLQQLVNDQVIYGGRVYEEELPAAPYRLHWYYGKEREVRSATERQQQPHEGFMTNNFVVPKSVLKAIPFDEQIVQYGHEDTLWGNALRKMRVPILHIDNPVSHLGLEVADLWLKKQKQAIENLYQLYQRIPDLEVKSLRYWQHLHRLGVLRLSYKWWGKQAIRWEQSLQTDEPPNFRHLDLLKIYWLEQMHRRHGKRIFRG